MQRENARQFKVNRVTSNLLGKPMLEIEPAPISGDGLPDLSDDLAKAIMPHLRGRDNISIRYIDHGLPTTATAVLASMDVEGDEIAISYSIRIMLFETKNKKVGSNVHIRPAQRHVKINKVRVGVYQEIKTTRTYDFHEIYDDGEQSRDDLERLVKLAHDHFIQHGPESTEETQPAAPKAATITVSSGSWSVHGGGIVLDYRLSGIYRLSGLAPPEINGMLRFDCMLTSHEANRIDCGLRVHLKPFHLSDKKSFIMGLFPTDGSTGGLVEVLAIPNIWDADAKTETSFCVHEDDVPKCLRAISSGKELNFLIIDQENPPPDPTRSFVKLPVDPLVNLRLTNDQEFKRIYEETCDKIEISHDATRARQLGEGWYRKRSWATDNQ